MHKLCGHLEKRDAAKTHRDSQSLYGQLNKLARWFLFAGEVLVCASPRGNLPRALYRTLIADAEILFRYSGARVHIEAPPPPLSRRNMVANAII